MTPVTCIDLETEPFGPGRLAPPPVCAAVQNLGTAPVLLAGAPMRATLAGLWRDAAEGRRVLVGHAIAYDASVCAAWLPEVASDVWGAYVRGAVQCTHTRERLLDIADGRLDGGRKYHLGDLAHRHLGVALDKSAESWRTRFGDLDGQPVESWPEAARGYALDDVRATAALWSHQEERARRRAYTLPDQAHQARAAFALWLISCWGVPVDAGAVAELRRGIETEMHGIAAQLAGTGLLQSGARSMGAIRARVESAFGAKGLRAPRTAPTSRYPDGQTMVDGETLEGTDDPALVAVGRWAHLEKILGTYVVALEATHNGRLHPSYVPLLVSGRTASYDPNIQNPPRTGGVRECIVAPAGRVLAEADYDSAEMRSWAQACVDVTGRSVLADRYRADSAFDPHLDFALTHLLGPGGDNGAIKVARQAAKIGNFGLPGGMGPAGLQHFAKGYGLAWSLERAKQVERAWRRQWPEAGAFFRYVRNVVGEAGAGTMVQLRSGRWRGLCGYTDGANTLFQGLTADAAKAALFEVARRCYSAPGSALFGSRPIVFLHDSVLLDAPEGAAGAAAADELRAVLIDVMQGWTPAVPAAATAVLMRRWSKEARPVRDATGALVSWTA